MILLQMLFVSVLLEVPGLSMTLLTNGTDKLMYSQPHLSQMELVGALQSWPGSELMISSVGRVRLGACAQALVCS